MLIRVNAFQYLYFFKHLSIALINESQDELGYDWDNRKVWTINTGNPAEGYRSRELFAGETVSGHDYFLRKYDEVKKKTKEAINLGRSTDDIYIQIEVETTTRAFAFLGFESSSKGFKAKAQKLWDEFIESPAFKQSAKGTKSKAENLWYKFVDQISSELISIDVSLKSNIAPLAKQSLAKTSNIINVATSCVVNEIYIPVWDYDFQRGINQEEKNELYQYLLRLDAPAYKKLYAFDFLLKHDVKFTDDEMACLFENPVKRMSWKAIDKFQFLGAKGCNDYKNIRGYAVHCAFENRFFGILVRLFCEELSKDPCKSLEGLYDVFTHREIEFYEELYSSVHTAFKSINEFFALTDIYFDSTLTHKLIKLLKNLVDSLALLDITQTKEFILCFRQIIKYRHEVIYFGLQEFLSAYLIEKDDDNLDIVTSIYLFKIEFKRFSSERFNQEDCTLENFYEDLKVQGKSFLVPIPSVKRKKNLGR